MIENEYACFIVFIIILLFPVTKVQSIFYNLTL
nr:MAG TPA: hypothetical protein [Caudoviricetes sp.]